LNLRLRIEGITSVRGSSREEKDQMHSCDVKSHTVQEPLQNQNMMGKNSIII